MNEYTTIIVGFGFSSFSLLQELDRTNSEYLIISDVVPRPIWATLKEKNRLNFDLVSSYYTSFYTHDIIKNYKPDNYPTANEFYAMHLEYLKKYEKIINWDTVTKIDNYDTHSIVHTSSGKTYKTTNVVIATGFQRKIHDYLTDFDYGITNKTIVFNTIGDSANLMISQLISGNNKIYLLHNGFLALDKMLEHNGKTLTLDQLEYHNVAYLDKYYYTLSVVGSPIINILAVWGGLIDKGKNIGKNIGKFLYCFYLIIGKITYSANFSIMYPDTIRPVEIDSSKIKHLMPIANGFIAIKNWPVDTYCKLFGDNLNNNIKNGYLLNDLHFFIKQGLVKCFKKNKTIIDTENKCIKHEEQIINFDYLIEGGAESPRLPPIHRHLPNKEGNTLYKYVYRDNYLGVVPKTLSNIYFIGFTRPTTGGLANITEIQSLFLHKMIINHKFNNEIYNSVEKRIKKYNMSFYLTNKIKETDHIVYYGTFTEEVSRVIGINIKLSDCRTFKDLIKLYFSSNNASKYRQFGEYKINGCQQFINKVFDNHRWFGMLPLLMLSYYIYIFMFIVMILKLYISGIFGIPLAIVALISIYMFRFMFITPTFYALPMFVTKYSIARFIYILLCALAAIYLEPIIAIIFIGTDWLLTVIIRLIKPEYSRLPFGDMRIKKKYEPFLKTYIKSYRSIFNIKP